MLKKMKTLLFVAGILVLAFQTTKVSAEENYSVSICSYDITNSQSCKGGQFRIYCDDYGNDELYYGGNNYFLMKNTVIRVKAYPDNGYAFVGWYKGKYLGGDNQVAEPYTTPVAELSTDTEYTFVLSEDTVICPVFEKSYLINFVDIGNVWDRLDPIHEIPFTGEVNPNEDGLDQFISIDEERWIGEEDMITSKTPGKVALGKKYSYETTIRAAEGYVFNTSEIRFVYGGTEYENVQIKYEDNNRKVTVSGFVPDTVVKPMSIKEAKITGVEDKEYTGKAITQTPKITVENTVLVEGVDYEISYANNVNQGTATMTITGKGNYGETATVTFKIYGKMVNKDYSTGKTPGKTAIKKAKKKGKKLSLKLSKAKYAQKYEIRIYKSKKEAKKDKNPIIKKKVKKLNYSISSKKIKKYKTIYVRVRAIATYGNLTRLGKWTKVKVVK
ncbi:MAG: hypothetical protein K6G85_06820 [Eubacterium sp.]|nr:hypothetical protein [Eubacterium sp.]